jgi:hypothetical protein
LLSIDGIGRFADSIDLPCLEIISAPGIDARFIPLKLPKNRVGLFLVPAVDGSAEMNLQKVTKITLKTPKGT